MYDPEYHKEYRKKNKERIAKRIREWNNANPKVFICKSCKKEFKRGTNGTSRKYLYCSASCTLAIYRTKEHQVKAGKIAGLMNIHKLRGTGTKTYVKEYGRHQHRVVMERVLGRKLRKGEIVHHIDENKKNNDPKNLMVMTQAEHCRLHFKKNKHA